MEELVTLVANKTGLSPEVSRVAVQTVLEYLKQKLPAPVASQIDAIAGSGGSSSTADIAKGVLGGILGKK
jgi:hypothetical protein